MEHKEIVWKEKTQQYANGKNAYVGKIIIGSCNWNSIDRNTDLKYVASFDLPQLPIKNNKFKTEQEAMNMVEKHFKVWFKEILK